LSTAGPEVSRPRTERLLLPGAAGDIETLVEWPASPPRAVAICCHPHPLYGGTMTNKVIHTVARSFVAAGAVAVRFNFRGVGASAGVHDDGRGETDDVLSIIDWARSRWPGLPLWLGGFSFGAWVTLRVQSMPVAGRERVQPALLVVVAPPVGRWDFSMIAAPACPWLVIQGTRDELVDADEVVSWVDALDGSGGLARLARFADADHFFHARLHELRDAVTGFVAEVDQRRSV
jgi:hypothetical protein